MLRPRVIPVLLLKNNALVKSIKFKHHRYIGDPINAVRIYNSFHADELILLDTDAAAKGRLISLDMVKDVGEEANMPFAVGGGIKSLNDIQHILNCGAEKVIIGHYAAENPDFILEASNLFGSSAICVCIDVKRSRFGKIQVLVLNGSRRINYHPVAFARLMEEKGAGEIIIQSINRDGTMLGYDIDLVKKIAESVDIPVIALGGAGRIEHMICASAEGFASGLAAGSMFVYQGLKSGVLINYPEKSELLQIRK